MKNQYFGDVNDYEKFGILRAIATAGLRTMVCWMLTPDEPTESRKKQEGSRLAYLDPPEDEEWCRYDPSLFDKLREIRTRVKQGDIPRCVALAPKYNLVDRAKYFEQPLNGTCDRRAYFQELWDESRGYALVMFDPDNGLKEQRGEGRTRSCKHLYWDELKQTFEDGHSLVVFQHFWRQKREDSIRMRVERVTTELHPQLLAVLPFAHAFYLVIGQPRHVAAFHVALDRLAQSWDLVLTRDAGATPVYRRASGHRT